MMSNIRGMIYLLKVFVTFYTMVATVCEHNISVWCDSYSLRSIYFTPRGVNEGEERTKLIKHLVKK